MGCDYLSLPEITVSGNKLIICDRTLTNVDHYMTGYPTRKPGLHIKKLSLRDSVWRQQMLLNWKRGLSNLFNHCLQDNFLLKWSEMNRNNISSNYFIHYTSMGDNLHGLLILHCSMHHYIILYIISTSFCHDLFKPHLQTQSSYVLPICQEFINATILFKRKFGELPNL